MIYQKLLKSGGITNARKYLRANELACARYKELCADTDCNYEIKDNYIYSVDDRKKLEAEMDALQKIGYDAELCDTIAIPFETAVTDKGKYMLTG